MRKPRTAIVYVLTVLQIQNLEPTRTKMSFPPVVIDSIGGRWYVGFSVIQAVYHPWVRPLPTHRGRKCAEIATRFRGSSPRRSRSVVVVLPIDGYCPIIPSGTTSSRRSSLPICRAADNVIASFVPPSWGCGHRFSFPRFTPPSQFVAILRYATPNRPAPLHRRHRKQPFLSLLIPRLPRGGERERTPELLDGYIHPPFIASHLPSTHAHPYPMIIQFSARPQCPSSFSTRPRPSRIPPRNTRTSACVLPCYRVIVSPTVGKSPIGPPSPFPRAASPTTTTASSSTIRPKAPRAACPSGLTRGVSARARPGPWGAIPLGRASNRDTVGIASLRMRGQDRAGIARSLDIRDRMRARPGKTRRPPRRCWGRSSSILHLLLLLLLPFPPRPRRARHTCDGRTRRVPPSLRRLSVDREVSYVRRDCAPSPRAYPTKRKIR